MFYSMLVNVLQFIKDIISTKQNNGQYHYHDTLVFILFSSLILSSVIIFPISGASGSSNNLVSSQQQSFSSFNSMPTSVVGGGVERPGTNLSTDHNQNTKTVPVSDQIPLAPPVRQPMRLIPSDQAAFSGCQTNQQQKL